MQVKNSGTTELMKVNDETGTEGAVGSIELPVGTAASGTTTNRLYNYNGNLYWGNNQLGTAGSAGGWTDFNEDVYLTSNADKVGIGTSTPGEKLVVEDGNFFIKGGYSILKGAGGGQLIEYIQEICLR